MSKYRNVAWNLSLFIGLPVIWATITNWELQNFEQIDNYNTSASPFFNQTGGFSSLGPQLSAYSTSFLMECCGILSEGSRMARPQKRELQNFHHGVSRSRFHLHFGTCPHEFQIQLNARDTFRAEKWTWNSGQSEITECHAKPMLTFDTRSSCMKHLENSHSL